MRIINLYKGEDNNGEHFLVNNCNFRRTDERARLGTPHPRAAIIASPECGNLLTLLIVSP